MGDLIEILSNFVQIFVWMWFITKSLGFKDIEKHRKIIFVSVWLIAFIELSLINFIVVFDGFLSAVVIVTQIIYARWFLKGKFFRQMFVIIFSMAIIYTLASLALLFFSYFSGENTQGLITNFSRNRIAMLLICRAFEIIIFRYMIKINSEYILSIKEWLLFTCLPLLTWISVTVMTQSTLNMKSVEKPMLYIAAMIVAIDIIIFFFMNKIKQDTELKYEHEMLKLHYDNVKNTEKNMRALYENTYSVKHDLEKHMLAIRALAESNKSNEIISYVSHIINDDLNAVQKIVFTDNDVFNAIINTKLQLCNEKKIYTSVNVSDEAVSALDKYDIPVLFGNIFDNAIEAAQNTKERIIVFNIQMKNGYVLISMENSYSNECSDIDLNTTKVENPEEHGFGTKTIKKLVKEKEGMIDYYVNDYDMFCCDILIKPSKNR